MPINSKKIVFGLFIVIMLITTTGIHANNKTVRKNYYIDSIEGNDNFDGISAQSPWKTIAKIQSTKLNPGDSIKFKNGSAYNQILIINDSGSQQAPIVITSYGDAQMPAPAFTNKVFEQDNFGNCIRLKGSYIIVENLYFHETPVYQNGQYITDGGWPIWEMGTVYIEKGAKYCIIRNNEFFDCPVGIKSYGEHAFITNNYLHDCNRVLKEWGWGPIGIWFGADYQEASYNRIFNYRAEDHRISWSGGVGGGADGGAFEVDDARYPKSNIHIHHNYTRDCQGFIEVTWTDVLQNPAYENFRIHHNISDDYQQFTAIWRGKNFEIDNNTIIRRKVNANDWGVFNITGTDTRNKIRNNIIITEKNIPIFNTGIQHVHKPNNIIQNNLYFAASGNLVLGKEGPGTSLVQGNPRFKNVERLLQADDFSLLQGSPAIDKGHVLNYSYDFSNTIIPQGMLPDIGAFEFQAVTSEKTIEIDKNQISNHKDGLIIYNSLPNQTATIFNMLGIPLQMVILHAGRNHIKTPVTEGVFIVQFDNKSLKFIAN
jgi:hypothetical protein